MRCRRFCVPCGKPSWRRGMPSSRSRIVFPRHRCKVLPFHPRAAASDNAGTGHGRHPRRPAREAGRHDRLLDLADALFRQPPLVQREAAHQMIAQRPDGQDAKPGAVPRVQPVSDRDDGVQVVVLDLPPHLPVALGLNYQGLLGSCRLGQFPLVEDVLEVEAHFVGRCVEEFGHLLLAQPDRLPIQPDVHPDRTVLRLVDDDFST